MYLKRQIPFLLLFILGLFSNNLLGQQIETVYLNKYFYPIEESDTASYFYKSITSEDKNGNAIERVFTKSDQLVRITRSSYNAEGRFNQEETENYNLSGELISQKTKNTDNGLFLAKYYDKGTYIGEALLTVDRTYEITKPGSSDVVTTEFNEFEPAPSTDKLIWQKHLMKNLSYPQEARSKRAEGTVIVALHITEQGKLEKIEIVNPVGLEKSLIEEVLRVTKSYKGQFLPARDLDGNPIKGWLTIPVRFKLS